MVRDASKAFIKMEDVSRMAIHQAGVSFSAGLDLDPADAEFENMSQDARQRMADMFSLMLEVNNHCLITLHKELTQSLGMASASTAQGEKSLPFNAQQMVTASMETGGEKVRESLADQFPSRKPTRTSVSGGGGKSSAPPSSTRGDGGEAKKLRAQLSDLRNQLAQARKSAGRSFTERAASKPRVDAPRAGGGGGSPGKAKHAAHAKTPGKGGGKPPQKTS